jgi:hypothetical protein
MEDGGGTAAETLWASALGGDHYRVANIPFYAYDVSLDNVIFAPFSSENSFPLFKDFLAKSGNRTIRVVFDGSPDKGTRSRDILDEFAELDCGSEGAHKTYFALNVPLDVSIDAIASILDLSGLKWEQSDPAE